MLSIEEFKNLPDEIPAPSQTTRPSQFANERSIVGFLATILYERLGEMGTWEPMSWGGVKFAFSGLKGTCYCSADIPVGYKLPDGSTMTHRPDIMADIRGRRMGIEVKFRCVTDSFKARSYDMIHIKRSNPSFYGIMVYIKSETGISPSHAKSLYYAHDLFFSIPETSAERSDSWDPLILEIRKLLK